MTLVLERASFSLQETRSVAGLTVRSSNCRFRIFPLRQISQYLCFPYGPGRGRADFMYEIGSQPYGLPLIDQFSERLIEWYEILED